MVSPAQRRAVVAWAQEVYRVSQHRACRAVVVQRSLVRYRSVRPDDALLRQRLRELAAARPSFGVRRLHVLLRLEGGPANHKRVQRLYQLEGLQLRPRKRRRRVVGTRQPPVPLTGPNERCAMDFMHDTLTSRQTIRVFTLVDVYTRECLALEVAPRFTGSDVARILSAIGATRGGLPPRVQCENGTEYVGRPGSLGYWDHVVLDFSRPGKPVDNTAYEAFNGSLRRECLMRHWFATVAEAQTTLDAWRADYNNARPHSRTPDTDARPQLPCHRRFAGGRGAPLPPWQGGASAIDLGDS